MFVNYISETVTKPIQNTNDENQIQTETGILEVYTLAIKGKKTRLRLWLRQEIFFEKFLFPVFIFLYTYIAARFKSLVPLCFCLSKY